MASSDEDEGGSSQDKFEKDFIDDGRREEIDQNKLRRLKKGHVSSSEPEFFTKSTEKPVGQSESEDEDDPYE